MSMTREELREFIITQVKDRRPDEADKAEEIADFILAQPSMQSEAGVRGFLKGFFENGGME